MKKIIQAAMAASLITIGGAYSNANAQTMTTLMSVEVNKNVSVIQIGDNRIHTFHGISNSHIIETATELRVVDAQMMFKQAKMLKAYIAKLGKPLVQVILSHNHPDHWFGAEIFSDIAPIATSKNVKQDLKNRGAFYIKIMKERMGAEIPDSVIVPTQTIELGKQNWDGLDVVVEEVLEQEAHHSLLIKIPAFGIMIGQDLFYNNLFLVASERKRNKNWRAILQALLDNEASTYKTLLVGHGKNGGPDILAQDIVYLDALEATMAKNLSKEDTQKAMISQFPEKGGKNMLGISINNLFSGH